ncbi:MAG TPA: hypothetical protein VNW52_00675 [Burkholderiaceae bacterium]|nr:hypothetical protein [Burkholderiaceae bacterium]
MKSSLLFVRGLAGLLVVANKATSTDNSEQAAMRILFMFIALWGLHIARAQAEDTPTLDQVLSQVVQVQNTTCLNLRSNADKFRANGKSAVAANVDVFAVAPCDCMPKQIASLRAKLSAGELSVKMSNDVFVAKLKPVIEACSKQQWVRFYSGADCPARLATASSNPVTYCTCMEREFGSLPANEIAATMTASSEWDQIQRKAKANGTIAPDAPAILQKFFAMNHSCGGSHDLPVSTQ